MRKPNIADQLDALAAAICGTDEVVRLAKERNVTHAAIYFLAQKAITRLQKELTNA